MKEKWKDICEYEGLYQVSSLGQVRSLDRYVKTTGDKKIYGVIKKPRLLKVGYYYVSLWKNGKARSFTVHRLVAKSFIKNPKNLPEVNHIDGCYTNNKSSNLEWVTHQENMIHAYKTGLVKPAFGENHGISKITKKDVISIRSEYVYRKNGTTKISRKYGISPSNVVSIIKRKTWNHV